MSGDETVPAGGRTAVSTFRFEAVAIVLLLITLLALRFQDELLKTSLVLTPSDQSLYLPGIYGDDNAGGKSTVDAADKKNPLAVTCHLRAGAPYPFCGVELTFDARKADHGVDLRAYDTMTLDMRYSGPAEQLKVQLKNFDPRYSKPGKRDSAKYNKLEIAAADTKAPLRLAMSEFSVADWWLHDNNIPPEYAAAQFDNVVALAFEPGTGARLGDHRFEIHSIRFEGMRIPKAQFYRAIMAFWAVLFVLYIAVRIIEQRRNAKAKRLRQERRNEELETAMAAAESANRAKSEFLANMSHELRTPLNAILGYAQLLQRKNLDEQRREDAARTIHESGSHLLTLITDILDLTKIEAGKLDLCSTSIDLAVCLKGVADMFRVRAAEKDLDFTCRVPADLPPIILGDEKRLRQVLINLLGNAIKFTEHGEVALEVSLLSATDGKARIRFEVRDTGVGIPDEQLAQIFQPFEQAGDIRRRAGGTGLGLSISSQIVRLMNSRIEVASREGEGSRFWFEIQVPVIEEVSQEAEAPPQRPTGYFGERRRILIVDDTDANRAVLNDWLSELGFETSEACDGQEAVNAAGSEKPDLILMDIKMPVMDGFEATARIRAMSGLKDVPIFAVSASATGEVEEKSRAAGADAFITKPIDESRLMQLIGRHLKVQWLTAADGPIASAPVPAAPSLTAPPAEELAVLLKHALAGNMRAIRTEADRIASLDADYEPFAQKILSLAAAYQSPAILRLIEDHGGPRSEAA